MTYDVVTMIDDEGLLEVVRRIADRQGYAPTLAQIAKEVGWRSRATAHRRITRLKEAGKLAGSGRTLRVVEQPRTVEGLTAAIEERLAADRSRAGGPHKGVEWRNGYGRGWRDGFRAGVAELTAAREAKA